ncbi:Aca2/YdiL-like domain-containing protein [Bradyrhizobium elkanii]|uniref:Aca2/YdiL-like domain-containing protein n=1 Tax=Bradyrhizobium elkanii TaxID=29448 RepID=UPI0035115FAF
MDLKATRKAAGLTQVAAAKMLGVSERTWRDWETGATAMPQAHRELFNIKARRRTRKGHDDTDIAAAGEA